MAAVESQPAASPRRRTFSFLRIGAAYYALVIVFILAAISQPVFFRWRVMANTVVQSTALGIAAVGQTFVILTAGIDLSVGPVISLTNAVAATMLQQEPGRLIEVVLLCLGIGLIVGLINGLAVAYARLNAFIFTLAIGGVVQGLTFQVLYQPGGLAPVSLTQVANGFLGPIPLPIVYLAVLYVVGSYVLGRTPFGLSIYAVGGNESSALLSGVRTQRVLVSVYVICSLLAAISGLFLTARIGSGDPLVGDPYTLDSITATVIGGASLFGGVGDLGGTLAGVLIIGILSTTLNLNNISPFYQWIIKGLILILALAVEFIRKRQRQSAVR